MRVVILTPSPARANILRRHVSAGPFRVLAASNPAEAAAIVREFEPAVVICDEQAEGFNWREVLDVAAAAPLPPAVLVVLSRFDASTWLRVLRSGAGEIVCEPLSAEKLIDAVERAARLSYRDERKPTGQGRSRLLALCRSVLGLGAAPRP